jgi:hypothetical protein
VLEPGVYVYSALSFVPFTHVKAVGRPPSSEPGQDPLAREMVSLATTTIVNSTSDEEPTTLSTPTCRRAPISSYDLLRRGSYSRADPCFTPSPTTSTPWGLRRWNTHGQSKGPTISGACIDEDTRDLLSPTHTTTSCINNTNQRRSHNLTGGDLWE